MSFLPDSEVQGATVKELLEQNNTLLKAIVLLLADANDESPENVIQDAESM